jgi:hypothetical protein
METQWRSATSALKTTQNLEKIKELSSRLSNANIKLVSLKKENQLMKEKLHLNTYSKPTVSLDVGPFIPSDGE